jgi:hypothetical protein
MSQDAGRGFLDVAASAFLRRRFLHQRLRAAAVRGLKTVSAEAGGRLHMDFNHAADCFARLPSWLVAHASEIAAAPTPGEATSSRSSRSAAGWRSGTACASRPTVSSGPWSSRPGSNFIRSAAIRMP